MATTWSWTTAAAALASRENRLRAAPLAAICGASTLIATTRESAGSNALSTTPMPACARIDREFRHRASRRPPEAAQVVPEPRPGGETFQGGLAVGAVVEVAGQL